MKNNKCLRLLNEDADFADTKSQSSLLDSSLISPTLFIEKPLCYNLKIVECGDYIQIYSYQDKKVKFPKKDDFDKKLKKKDFDLNLDVSINISNKTETKQIELKNAIRSKIECQRLAKANKDVWKTFITLTFKDNITNITIANTKFRYFIDKIRRIYPELKYLCVPEFQKRGSTHYHLITNIDISNVKLIETQIDNNNFKHIKYWNEGFTKVDSIKNDIKKVIGYIAKYMTKDIDNKLFGKHRYFYSQNLIKPKEYYIDLNDSIQREFYTKKIQDKMLIYTNEYINPYNSSEVTFLEFFNNE